ncbi:MAG TPA: KUP/HAK/KT family potassium transporter, partial [Tepidisphaeraceae bacterium]|nr:KUP/HAK/KT family potassium transporter [Tepidisphaeraceae bacterium]
MPANRRAFATLALGALGVVFGDIGTSPLYTIQSTFGDAHAAIAPNAENILGVLSVMFWLLVLIVSL